jgi:hypothetical protein
VADIAPSGPWARRRPNSMIWPRSEASHTRAVLVATRLWKFTVFRRSPSISCASIRPASMRIRGSWGNTIVPSGTAQTSPLKRKSRR